MSDAILSGDVLRVLCGPNDPPLRSPTRLDADGRLLTSPLGEHPNFQRVSAVFFLVFVKATEAVPVFHLAVAGCLLAWSLMPPGGRRAAVNAVLSVFCVLF